MAEKPRLPPRPMFESVKAKPVRIAPKAERLERAAGALKAATTKPPKAKGKKRR
jgi:hypothetical protein